MLFPCYCGIPSVLRSPSVVMMIAQCCRKNIGLHVASFGVDNRFSFSVPIYDFILVHGRMQELFLGSVLAQ